MTRDELHVALNSGRLSKNDIDALVSILKVHPELVQKLLDEVETEDKNGTFNASWVFDNLMRKRLNYLIPFIEQFITTAEHLKSESCIRPMAHVCQMLTEAYFVKKERSFQQKINTKQLERLVTVCFDWLIGSHKIAAKVFAMTSLLHLGKQFNWVHPELKSVLEQTIATGTAGYKSRAKKTLDELNTLGH